MTIYRFYNISVTNCQLKDPVHVDPIHGFWCINDEQPRDHTCADFEVRFCCPDVFPNPCAADNLSCAPNSHVVFESVDDGAGGTMDQCSCKCDDGYVIDAAEANPFEGFDSKHIIVLLLLPCYII